MILWNGSNKVYRLPGAAAPFSAEEVDLECCCCDATLGSCDPPLAYRYTVTIPAGCVLTTCDSSTPAFGGAYTVAHQCRYNNLGLASPLWRNLDAAPNFIDLLWGQNGSFWEVATWDSNFECVIYWRGPATICDPTGVYSWNRVQNTCSPCAKNAACAGNVVVS